MIVPTSIDIMLPESTRAGLNTDDQKKAIDYMYGSMLDETKKVNIYDTLMSHNDEYLYFRTDHHWTALGAYYAYEEFAKAKGVKPLPLPTFCFCVPFSLLTQTASTVPLSAFSDIFLTLPAIFVLSSWRGSPMGRGKAL